MRLPALLVLVPTLLVLVPSAALAAHDDGAVEAEIVFADVPAGAPFAREMAWLATEGVSTGWGSGAEREYRPYESITRDAMAAFLYRLAGSPDVTLPARSPFVDVTPSSTRFYTEIVWLADAGISGGWATGRGKEFRPFESITRDAMAAFLYRYAEAPAWAAPQASPFADVTTGSSAFYAEITWLAGMEVSTGWDTRGGKEYRPFGKITRDAMAAFLYRLHTRVLSGGDTGAPDEDSAAPGCPTATVDVSTGTQLKDALASAEPGDVIVLADGHYSGNWAATRRGTSAGPITLCGSSEAVLDGGSISHGYVLHLDGADHWAVRGITVRNGMKGIMLDESDHVVIDGVTVEHVGDEAVHLRAFSSDNVVRNSLIRDTGNRTAKFGEGVYVGSSVNNWDTLTGDTPDRSDRNVIEHNTIIEVTAEAVDVKEGSSNGVVRANEFDGSHVQMPGADSWVDVKGNGWLIEGNVGRNSPNDGFQTHELVDGWGTDNVFRDNEAIVDGPGYGFSLTPVRDNVVSCSNVVTRAAEGYSNTACE